MNIPTVNKIIQVSHNDLDGIGCIILMKKALGERITKTYQVGYDELEELLAEIDKDCWLILTDLSVPENLAPTLRQFRAVTIIDHHETSKVYDTPAYKDMDVLVDMSHCATWLIVDWLNRIGYPIPNKEYDWYYTWRFLVNDYDMWILQEPDSRRLNALYFISMKKIQYFLNDAMKYQPAEMIDRKREWIDPYLQRQDEHVDKTAIYDITDAGGELKVGLAFSDKYQSMIGDRMLRKEGYDLAYVVNTYSRSVSIRSKDYDCSKIAQRYGGGGHKPASGFQLKEEQIRMMIDALCLPTWGIPLANVTEDNIFARSNDE